MPAYANYLFIIIYLISLTTTSYAETFLNASESDPFKMSWMKGSPPPPDRIIRFSDGSYFNFPAMRWSVSNFRQLMPTKNILRGHQTIFKRDVSLNSDIDSIKFIPLNQTKKMSWKESLLANYTNGIIVLHKGKIIYEKYFGVLTQEGQHAAMSITKTFIGTLAATLVSEGLIDINKSAVHYVPELKTSALGTATIRQLMDMTTGVQFSENYNDPKAEIWKHAMAGNPLPKPNNYQGPMTYYEFLQTLKPQGNHGEAFHYKTVNSDTLGWVLSRVTGKDIAQIISERVWKKMRVEEDAYITVDSIGTPFAGGGLNLSLRDLASFGEMIRNKGRFNEQQIIPAKAILDIQRGGEKSLFAKSEFIQLKGWSYRNMWWITHNEHNAFMARGVHGQALYIDPRAEMVIARFASHPIASNTANDPTTLPAFHEVAKYLMNKKK